MGLICVFVYLLYVYGHVFVAVYSTVCLNVALFIFALVR